MLSLLAGPRGATCGTRHPEGPLGSQLLSLPANHREAAEDIRGDHRRPRLLEPGKSATHSPHAGTAAVRSCDTVGSLQALGALHDSCLAAKKKSQLKALSAALHLLLRSLQDPCCPSYSAAVLLEALSQVNGEVRPHYLWVESRCSCPF